MAAAMRRLAVSLNPRISLLLQPHHTPAAFSTWTPRHPEVDPTPIYLRVMDKIEEMKTAPLSKDALKSLQNAEQKAKKHFMVTYLDDNTGRTEGSHWREGIGRPSSHKHASPGQSGQREGGSKLAGEGEGGCHRRGWCVFLIWGMGIDETVMGADC
ncbi:uncharacterized protein LOC102719272 isoform X2 [Oryza brachyantha]|uniref:uncharacterized protein LOC102719272 isoform X2 n=1 Tax=Oryza brachyantha TaxID=4533 RepID=UPI00077684DC|nr:uncharacterized protein LOC102719272 isoform X2 [Oryza brachyantha]